MSENLVNQSGRSFSAPVTPNPLPSDIAITCYNIEKDKQAIMTDGVFDGKFVWMFCSKNHLGRINVGTGEIEYFALETEFANAKLVYAEGYIWIFCSEKAPYQLYKINVLTGEQKGYPIQEGVNGNSNLNMVLGSGAVEGGIFDGSYIWYLSASAASPEKKLIQVDIQTGTMTGHPINDKLEFKGYNSIHYYKERIWLTPTLSIYDIVEIDPKTLAMTYHSFSDGEIWDCAGGVCAEDAVWIMPYATGSKTKITKYDIKTGEVSFYTTENGVNGNIMPASGKQIELATLYDGKYIWFGSRYAGPHYLFRLDPNTGTIISYPYTGNVIGEWVQSNRAYDFILDGKNIWGTGEAAWIKISPAIENNYTIGVDYKLETGEYLRQGATVWVAAGEAYQGTAPEFEGYLCTKHIIDGVEFSGSTANIEVVNDNHIVIFIYKEGQPGTPEPKLTITERFLNSDGAPVLPQNTLYPEAGSDYQNIAPRVAGFKRVGHKIDDGETQTTRTARLQTIQTSHVVTFLYEPCDGEACIDYEFIITESYYNVETGEFILHDTYEYLDAGEHYRKTAPRLSGYNRVGHRIDGGEAVTTRTAVIENVQNNHHVFFLYEPCDGENCIDVPGGPGDGENPDPGPGGGGPGDGGNGNGGDGCTCGDVCHCENCTCTNCNHNGGGENPGGGGENPGGGGENPGGGGENPGGGGENPGGGGENPGGGGENPGGGGENPGGGGENPGGGNGNSCCCGCNPCCMPMMPCMPMMVMPVMMMPCMPCMPTMNWGCNCNCNCATTTKPSTPEPGDEDDVDDCNDPL